MNTNTNNVAKSKIPEGINKFVDTFYHPELNAYIEQYIHPSERRTFLIFIITYFAIHLSIDTKNTSETSKTSALELKKEQIKEQITHIMMNHDLRYEILSTFNSVFQQYNILPNQDKDMSLIKQPNKLKNITPIPKSKLKEQNKDAIPTLPKSNKDAIPILPKSNKEHQNVIVKKTSKIQKVIDISFSHLSKINDLSLIDILQHIKRKDNVHSELLNKPKLIKDSALLDSSVYTKPIHFPEVSSPKIKRSISLPDITYTMQNQIVLQLSPHFNVFETH